MIVKYTLFHGRTVDQQIKKRMTFFYLQSTTNGEDLRLSMV